MYRHIVFVEEKKAELLPLDRERIPDRLGDTEILVETDYTLISPGTELSWYSGIQREVAGDAFSYPVYTGYCHTGRILQRGRAVSDYAEGDRVVTGAGHVSHVIVDTRKNFEAEPGDLRKPVAKVPDGLNSELAPFAKIGEIAFTALRIADFTLGEKVLILGQGMVGNLAAQLFLHAGADVMVADISDFRLRKARDCGIDMRVNPDSTDISKVVDEWTGGVGADVTVESTGNSKLLLDSVRYTRRLGDLIILGTPRRAIEFNPTPDLWQAHMKGITVKGALRCLFYPLHASKLHRRSVERDLEETLRLMAEGGLRVEPLHTHNFVPRECRRAYDELLEAGDRAVGATFDWKSRTDSGATGGFDNE
ncbi:MAG: zinc-binding alcohol dehydrogenase [Spirochaetota bacterium]|nr:zinc-binding alcohol dehydrogenase [Spirochaetota bacterium]